MTTCKLDFWDASVSERSIASVQGLSHLMAQLKIDTLYFYYIS